jgi:hypothetical protein
MHSVSSLSPAQTIIIRVWLTVCPHVPCTFRESEFMDSLTKTVKFLRREIEVHLNELIHKNKGAISSIQVLITIS